MNPIKSRKYSTTCKIEESIINYKWYKQRSFSTVFTMLTLNIEQFYELRNFGWENKCSKARIIKNKCT